MSDYKWINCPIVEKPGPGPLTHFPMVSVIHPDRAIKKSFDLFRNPADMKYRNYSKIKVEGVYIFGGRTPDG